MIVHWPLYLSCLSESSHAAEHTGVLSSWVLPSGIVLWLWPHLLSPQLFWLSKAHSAGQSSGCPPDGGDSGQWRSPTQERSPSLSPWTLHHLCLLLACLFLFVALPGGKGSSSDWKTTYTCLLASQKCKNSHEGFFWILPCKILTALWTFVLLLIINPIRQILAASPSDT